MLLFVTPNPCIERTYLMDDFACGNVHRVEEAKVLLNAGGKGINAARVASKITPEVLSLCWIGDTQIDWFKEQLNRENVPHQLIAVPAQTRTCINILRSGKPKTEIVEAGSPLSQNAGTLLLEQLKVLLPKTSLLAVCGSYPPEDSTGSLEGHLQQIAQLAQEHQVRLLVDGKGKAFKKLLLSEIPLWAIKPNTDEAAEITGQVVETPEQEIAAVKALLQYNVQNVFLSCGKRGAYWGTRTGIEFFESPKVDEVSAVGSGDSLVGALCAQWMLHQNLRIAMCWGIAAGAANAAQQKSAFCTKDEIEKLVKKR